MHARWISTLTWSLFCLVVQLSVANARAGDWPTWRYDATRSATTPDGLADALKLAWRLDLPAPRPAWPEDARLLFDATYEPVVAGKTMFVASAQTDSVAAYETETGALRWQFFADGPVRLAPTVVQGCVLFGADDGRFYCLDAGDGRLRWKVDVAQGPRQALGNDRLISVWPVRGATVVAADMVHFTVGVWPFEGTFLYSFDLQAAVTADGTPPQPVVTLLSDRSPQGYLVADGQRLWLPCGRDSAAMIDIATRQPVPLQYAARALSDYHVTVSGKWLLHGHQVVDSTNGAITRFELRRPVTAGNEMIGGREGNIVAYDLDKSEIVVAKDPRGNRYKMRQFDELWRVPAGAILRAADAAGTKIDPEWQQEIMLRAGQRAYGHWGSVLFAVDPPAEQKSASVAWVHQIEGDPASMVAADQRLFVATRQGHIYSFASGHEGPPKIWDEPSVPLAKTPLADEASALLAAAGGGEGYCLVWGIGSGQLIDELVRQSSLHVIAVDPDADKVARLRRTYTQGPGALYGQRVAAIAADPRQYAFPAYMANLVVAGDLQVTGLDEATGSDKDHRLAIGAMFQSLRPYGGKICLALDDAAHQTFARQVAATRLSRARLTRQGQWTILTREGALEGAADWTHEYGDPANTLMSRDRLVKAPLGVLWFGGPSAQNELFFDRHFWGPGAAIIDGRMFLQGPERFGAVDIYTGRLLWKLPLERGSSPGRRGNFYDGDDNTGYHFIVVSDAVYLTYNNACWRLDPATGKKLGELTLPDKGDYWGPLRAWKDLLVVQVFDSPRKTAEPVKLVALNRHTGKLVWQQKVEQNCPLVAIGNDRVFYFDGRLPGLFNAWTRKGRTPAAKLPPTIKALDARTGEPLWQRELKQPVTWLAYSEKQDVLAASNREGIEALLGASGSSLWSKSNKANGFEGHPENRWDRVIVWNDWLIDQRGPAAAYEIYTGKEVTRTHPLTGQQVPWRYTQSGHHCAYAVAGQNLLTFRAATGGFVDLETLGSSRLSGFRSGCRNSLLPAGGILNAPNFGHGCICSYSVFTSLALVHVPEVEQWSYSALPVPKAGEVERIGINLGAPGDRLADGGTLWLDYPNVGGSSPDVEVQLDAPQARWFRLHTSQVTGEGPKWVGASGVEGLRSLSIKLPAEKADGAGVPYFVRLYFAEPDDMQPGERVFDVAVGGNKVLEGVDVVQQAGGRRRVMVKQFDATLAAEPLRIEFQAHSGQPILAGVEIVRR